ncbi:MAG: ATP-binding protein [Pseudobdellovibrionaceae bacterium]|nr:ATP-binding protein [Pseudobdellovibrionaceae bacterium]
MRTQCLRLLYICMTLLIIQFERTAWAESASLPSWKEFKWQLLDDPETAHNWALNKFESMPAETSIEEKVRIASFFINSVSQTEKRDMVHKHITAIEEFWKKADELSMHIEKTALGDGLAYCYRLINQLEKSDRIYQQTIDDARRFHMYEDLVNLLLVYSLFLDGEAHSTLALKYRKEAFAIALDKSFEMTNLTRYNAILTAALFFLDEGSVTYEGLVEEAMTNLIKEGTRYYIGIQAYTVGASYARRDPTKARFYLELSKKEASKVNDKSTVGAAWAELAKIEISQGSYNEGERKAAEAARILGEDIVEWYAEARMTQANALMHLGRLTEALAALEKVLPTIPEQKTWKLAGYEIQFAILEKMGLHKRALESLKVIRDFEKRESSEREDENFARAKVNLGLQLEEQKNLLLQKENELQAARLKTSRYLLIAAIVLGLLLVGAVASTIWALSNARKIQKAREKIQIILDVIEEGILTINLDLRPEPEYSRYLTRLYPSLFRGEEDAIDWLFPAEMLGQERQSIIRETLRACLGEESLAWDLNAGQLPSEIVLPGEIPRSIHILWQPLMNNEERIKGFLLSLRDISDQKRLQDEVLQQKEKSKALEQRVQELLLTRFQDARRLIEALEEKLKSPDAFWLEAASKRDLHTRKGEARTLGLEGLSEAIHNLESALFEGKAESISQAITVLREETGAYHTLMRDMFTSRSTDQESATSLMDLVGPLLPALRKQLKEGGIPVRSIDVSDGVDEWPADVLEAVRQSLLHALSNSVDHGYILPSRRGQRLSPAVLRVEADTDPSGKILVRVRDFGAGLNMEKLTSMAEEKGFSPGPDETVADVVFLDGATTAETASTTSGRGVGLSVVRELCRNFKGDAHLLANDQGQGSLLVMSFEVANEHSKLSA